MEVVESVFAAAVQWLKLILEVTGAAFVGIGGLTTLGYLVRALTASGEVRFSAVRLHFARYLSLALEFQLGADILGTTIAPSWEQIGKLGAIAVIRTVLNYFLGREMKEEKEIIAGEAAVKQDLKDSAASRAARSASSAV